jgi:polyisoprenyl-teichoic acid--peptidoglycan teichoic acid transferase
MANKKPERQPREFDIHRTLPSNPRQAVPHAGRRAHNAPHHTSAAVSQSVAPKKRRFTWTRLFASIFLGALLFVIFIAAWDARNISHASAKMFGSGNLMQALSPTSLKGSDHGRVNVLIVGYSVDDPGHPGASLTDSIMLLSMSTTNHTGYMLSIPRDLYVKIPGYGAAKINEAYKDGGISLLEQIIENNFQTHIDYSALLDYTAVRDSVNALGGVTVNIKSPDPRGLYDPNISPADGGPLKLPNGPQQIDGQTALNLTRARGDAYGSYGFPQSDFNRTEHQRQVFTAMKEKLNWKLILDPRKNGEVFDAFANNVKTDVTLGEVRPLYGLFNGIPASQLQSISLNNFNGKNLLASTYYEGSTLSPAAGANDYSDIDAALNQLNSQ